MIIASSHVAERWDRAWNKALCRFVERAGVEVEGMICVCCGSWRYGFDKVTVLPVAECVKELFAGEIF